LLAATPREFGPLIRVVDDRRNRPSDIIGVVRVDQQSRIAGNLRQARRLRRPVDDPYLMAGSRATRVSIRA
jgi:hypothetical protein